MWLLLSPWGLLSRSLRCPSANHQDAFLPSFSLPSPSRAIGQVISFSGKFN